MGAGQHPRPCTYVSAVPESSDSAPAPRSLPTWAAPLLVFALALLVTAALVGLTMRSIAQSDRAAFEAEATRTSDAVRERIDTTVTLLHGIAGLFASQQEVRRAEFSVYVGQLRLRERYPGILGVGWSVRLTPQALPQAVAYLRAQGASGFRVWPEGPRDEYHSIAYLEPQDARNQAAIGYDMYTEDRKSVV